MGSRPHTLDLAVEIDDDFLWWGLVPIVDGERLFDAWHGASIPVDELLGDPSPLLTGLPHRVALRVCSCGSSGCGSASAVIIADELSFAWTEWRVWLPFGADEDPDPQRPPDPPDLAFERAAYEAAVAAAVAAVRRLPPPDVDEPPTGEWRIRSVRR